MKENKKRFVPEVEIGLALLHCSTVQHCNPALKFEALWKPDDAAQLKIKTSKVLVTETEEPIPAVLEVRHLNISATQSQNPGPSRVEVIPVRQPTVYAENTEPTVQQDSAVPTIIELEDSADEEMPSESTKSQANKRKPSLPTQKITPKPSAPKKARFEAIFDDNSELIVNEEEAAPVQKTTADKTANKVANAFERLKELRMNPAKKMPAQDGSSKTVKQPAKKIAEKGPSKNTPADIDAIAKR